MREAWRVYARPLGAASMCTGTALLAATFSDPGADIESIVAGALIWLGARMVFSGDGDG